MSKTTSTLLFVGFLGAGALAPASQYARAQPAELTIDPSGEAPPPSQPVESTAAPATAPMESGEPVENIYYGDYVDGDLDIDDEGEWEPVRFHGVVPLEHTVRRGDTLWDISEYYFNNAWNWPKVWALNPEITNPHWIYPGNIVRLREGTVQPSVEEPEDGGDGSLAPTVTGGPGPSFGLRQFAYVDIEELEDAGTVDGSIQEKGLLSAGDSVYISYEGGQTPEVGETYAIYTEGKKIKRDGKTAGHYVEVAGELRVTFAKEGKRARALILRSVNPVERGMRVGPLELNFDDVQPVANEQKVDGTVVELIGPDQLIGAQAAVIIDRGRDDGVKVGNRFLVIRRGDAYATVMEPSTGVAQDDERYPARAIGEIIVVQTGDAVSLGAVTFSIHEFGVGDRVFMRKGQ